MVTALKKRFCVGISRGTNESQKLPEDYHDQLLAFRRSIIHLRERHDYTLHNIANMDQTMGAVRLYSKLDQHYSWGKNRAHCINWSEEEGFHCGIVCWYRRKQIASADRFQGEK